MFYHDQKTFEPGCRLGLWNFHWSTGVIRSVESGGQAERKGVLPGMQMVAVNGKCYSAGAFNSARLGEKQFTVTFHTKAPLLQLGDQLKALPGPVFAPGDCFLLFCMRWLA